MRFPDYCVLAAHFPVEAGNIEGSEKVLPDLMPFKLKYTPAAAREKVIELDQYLYVCARNRGDVDT